jgi:large subunit ribosomal protein L30
MATLSITQHKSSNGCKHNQLATLESIGLRKIGQTVEREDSPQLRGMIRVVSHLVNVEEK